MEEAQAAEVVLAHLPSNEDDFASLVRTHHASLVRVAMSYVGDPAIAEDLAQETWAAVIKSLDRFAGRCSLKTWIFRILTNLAKTRAQREARSIPFSSLVEDDEGGPAEQETFARREPHGSSSRWSSAPPRWREPEELVLAAETRGSIVDAIRMLPPMQREVITLRGIEGRSAEEVCELLSLSKVNQRVLLHRARARVRAALG